MYTVYTVLTVLTKFYKYNKNSKVYKIVVRLILMGKKGYSYIESSESGNWNVADSYSKLKIMKHLYEADQYETIATFGAEGMVEGIMLDESLKNVARVNALTRLLKCLSMIINNTIFAVKSKDKETLKKLKKDLKEVGKAIPMVSSVITNQRTRTNEIKIEEKIFRGLLDILIRIKSDINEPLNRADLIFSSSEEMDPDEMMKRIEEDIIMGG